MRFPRLLTLAVLILTAQAAAPQVTGPQTAKENPPFDLAVFANKIEKRLKGNCTGYQFVVSFKGEPKVKRSGGLARSKEDQPIRLMSNDERYNIASISKTITAIAVMKLADKKGIHIGKTPMSKFLPDSFTLGPHVTAITMQQLLTHTSGLLCDAVAHEEMKDCIKVGVLSEEIIGDHHYKNINYALFRFVIPHLIAFEGGALGKTGDATKPGPSVFIADEPAAYIDYVRKNVFEPAGLPKIFCKPGLTPGLGYQFPGPKQKGTDFGDRTDTCGSGGWNMSTNQMAAWFGAFMYSDKILPRPLVDTMKAGIPYCADRLSFGLNHFTDPLEGWYHGGYYPGSKNPGQLDALVYGLQNGVSVVLIANSQVVDPDSGNDNVNTKKLVDAALKEMLP